jgi:hypothetical protein
VTSVRSAKIKSSSARSLLRAAALALSVVGTTAARAASVSITDAALVSAGVAAAGGSIAFAGLMLAGGGGQPRINGLEYLAIFAQPNGSPRPDPVSAALFEPAPRVAEQAIDASPTGSINRAETIAPLSDDGFHIVGGRSDLIWMRRGQTITAVRPGDFVAGLGLVGSIARRGGSWVLLDPAGAPLPVNGAAGASRPGPPSRLSKSLIFDQ